MRLFTCRGTPVTSAGGYGLCSCESLQCVCHLYQFTCPPGVLAKQTQLTPFSHLHTNLLEGTCCWEGHATPRAEFAGLPPILLGASVCYQVGTGVLKS
ncbi:hypothetical protein E2C01_075120 [Portunus trituberculatus]|uniref:Uncharacterized protein n=1 Tax=Portunus trituberculatus TaxID=210409 RepID=A0A5B7I7N3_PORTR|nr:hypothetical protein [Portunus trituberculatus]